MRFVDISDKYEKVVESCQVYPKGSYADFTFRDGKKIRFESPSEAERYIRSHYAGYIGEL